MSIVWVSSCYFTCLWLTFVDLNGFIGFIIAGDFEQLGKIWKDYWQLKKQMATGCEPVSVAKMIKALDPYVYSCCLAGAGGGGFLYVLTKEPNQRDSVARVLGSLKVRKPTARINYKRVVNLSFTMSPLSCYTPLT